MGQIPNWRKKKKAYQSYEEWDPEMAIYPYWSQEEIPSDVLGSYTGIGLEDDFYPEQDADDL